MIDVSCAIILNEAESILVVQRGKDSDHPYKWEFPGGKVDSGESPEESVIREISEELAMDIIITGILDPVEYVYSFKSVKLIPFICHTLDDEPVLTEHISFRWVSVSGLASIDLCEADVEVARRYISLVSAAATGVVGSPSVSEGDLKELGTMIEGVRTAGEAVWLAGSAMESPEMLNSLVAFTFSENRRLSLRAAWILGKLADKNPEKLLPFLNVIIDGLDRMSDDGTLRCILRIVAVTDPGKIDTDRHGLLADYCFNALNSGGASIAVKAYSMEILYRLVQLYPELTGELVISLSMINESESAGVRARAKMILKKLARGAKDQGSSLL